MKLFQTFFFIVFSISSSVQYYTVLDMNQQCCKRIAENSKPTKYWFYSPFAFIIIFFFSSQKESAGPFQRSSHKLPFKLYFDVKTELLMIKLGRNHHSVSLILDATLQQTAFCYCQIFSISTLWARAPAAVFPAPCCLFL